MNLVPERIEAQCPRCGSAIILTAGSRRKKVQCPRCREVVPLAVSPSEPPAPAAVEFEELRARVERLEKVVELLLAQPVPAGAPTSPRLPGESLLSPGTSLRWLRRDAMASRTEADAEQESVLLHNLRALGQREVVLRSAAEDETARQWTERLSTLFRQAGWVVQGPETAAGVRHKGLVIAAGQCPLPKAATATYMALKAAGFEIDSRLDSSLKPDESVLIAGSGGGGM